MNAIAHRHTLIGLCYVLAGMALGIYMAATHNHQQHVAHAHALLVGFVVPLLYAGVYRLWLPQAASRLAWLQFTAHHLGALFMSIGLFLMYGQWLPRKALEPVLALSAVSVLLGALLMLVLFVRTTRTLPSTRSEGHAVQA